MEKSGVLWVSYAPLDLVGKHIKARYEEVEHLLTYFGKPKEARKKLKSIPRGRLHIKETRMERTLAKSNNLSSGSG